MDATVKNDIDAIYAEIGEDATYNGSDVSVCNFRELGLQDAGEFVRETAECRVRIGDVASIAKGSDTLVYSGNLWLVDDVERSDGYEHKLILVREYAGQM